MKGINRESASYGALRPISYFHMEAKKTILYFLMKKFYLDHIMVAIFCPEIEINSFPFNKNGHAHMCETVILMSFRLNFLLFIGNNEM